MCVVIWYYVNWGSICMYRYFKVNLIVYGYECHLLLCFYFSPTSVSRNHITSPTQSVTPRATAAHQQAPASSPQTPVTPVTTAANLAATNMTPVPTDLSMQTTHRAQAPANSNQMKKPASAPQLNKDSSAPAAATNPRKRTADSGSVIKVMNYICPIFGSDFMFNDTLVIASEACRSC